MDFYEMQVTTNAGEIRSMVEWRGQVVLVVNTASRCGFTPQYEGLQTLQDKFGPRGFAVLAFPCDQFGHQEPGSDAEILGFCETNYRITFPLFAKIKVNGPHAHPLFVWLKKKKGGGLLGSAIKWNFTKFLVGPDGTVLDRFPPTTSPKAISPRIADALGAAAPAT